MDELRKRLADGDQSAFAELYDLLSPRLYRYLLAQLSQPDDAADVLQETFVRLARFRQQLRQVDGELVGYIFTIARNEAWRLLAKQNRAGRVATELIADQESVAPQQCMMDVNDEVSFALASLNPSERELVRLKVFGGLTFAEIATATETSQGTVATRYRAALRRMRKLLSRKQP